MGQISFDPVLDDRHYAVFIEARGAEMGTAVYPTEESIDVPLEEGVVYDVYIPMFDGTETHLEIEGSTVINLSSQLPNIKPTEMAK